MAAHRYFNYFAKTRNENFRFSNGLSYINDLEQRPKTKFITTRFGNVLGSNGSVIPRFKKQIENGGPITITHPEITRFFMTIPEAAQLVIQASSMATGGDVFVLDMGEPTRIYDLAKNILSNKLNIDNFLFLHKDV